MDEPTAALAIKEVGKVLDLISISVIDAWIELTISLTVLFDETTL